MTKCKQTSKNPTDLGHLVLIIKPQLTPPCLYHAQLTDFVLEVLCASYQLIPRRIPRHYNPDSDVPKMLEPGLEKDSFLNTYHGMKVEV